MLPLQAAQARRVINWRIGNHCAKAVVDFGPQLRREGVAVIRSNVVWQPESANPLHKRLADLN